MKTQKFPQTMIGIALIGALALGAMNCAKEDYEDAAGTENLSGSEVAASVIGGAVSADAGGGLAFFEQGLKSPPGFFAWLEKLLPNAYADSCLSLMPWTSCSGGRITQALSGCTLGAGTVVWDGSAIYAFNKSGLTDNCPTSWADLAGGGKMVRTFAAGTTRTSKKGTVVTFDTDATVAASGWDGSITLTADSTFNSFGTVTIFTSAGVRSLTQPGVHMKAIRTGVKTSGETVTKRVWDHTVNTTGTIDIAISGTSKTINSHDTNSLVIVQHNASQWTAKISVEDMVFDHGADGCGCFAVSGTLTTTYTGSKTGTETLTFNKATTGTCGSASLVDAAGATSNVVLSHCL